jgi:DNA ligase-1
MRPKIKKYDLDSPLFNYAHTKLDGHWLDVSTDPFGKVTCLSRQNTPLELSWVPSLKNVWLRVPRDSGLFGELWLPGQPASAIKTAIVQKNPELQFSAFAVYKAAGVMVPDRVTLSALDVWCVKHGLKFTSYWAYKLLFDHGPNCLGSWSGRGSDLTIPDGSEGFMLKNGNLADWTKLKPFLTADLKVVAVLPGEGRNLGRMGSLRVVTKEGIEVADVGGFSDYERELPESYWLGKIIEVKYYYLGSQNRLRHPTFVRVRDESEKQEADIYEGL